MTRLISEAGEPAVEPRAAHVEALEATLLGRLGPARPPRRRRRRVLAASAAAAVAAVACWLAPAPLRPTIAWGQVAEAMQGRPWIHGTIAGPDGRVAETWFSPRRRVMGARYGPEAEFHDLATRTYTKSAAAEGTVYRLPEDDRADLGLDFYRQLLAADGPSLSPISGMAVVGQSRKEVAEGGRAWLDIELSLKVIAADRPPQAFRVRVDPATRLPRSCTFEVPDGPPLTTVYDYPDSGPVDIYDLGVPRGLKVVDRVPGGDLERVRDGLKAGRTRFDDYKGLVVVGVGPGHVEGVTRVWRKGRMWRAESLHPAAPDFPQPRGDAEAWWRAHERDHAFVPTAICDGRAIRYYRAKGPWVLAAKEPPAVELATTQPIHPSDDPFMPWPNLLPEQLAHPSIWPPTEGREITAEPRPADGPPGTIRVRVRDTRVPDDGQHPDLYRLWIDPVENSVSMRTEMSVPRSSNPLDVAFVQTQVVEALGRSPGGHAYPTRVRRTTADGKAIEDFREQVAERTSYYLDFAAEIPDALFRAP